MVFRPILVTEDDDLLVTLTASHTAQIQLSVQMSEDREGRKPRRPILVALEHSAGDRVPENTVIELPSGWIQDGLLFAEGGIEPGSTVINLLFRSFGRRNRYLAEGQVHSLHHLPFGTFENPLDGPGQIRTITGTNPAAGVEISETVPTNAKWRLIAVSVSQAAGAADFHPSLVIQDNANVEMARMETSAAITGGTTEVLTWAVGLDSSNVLGTAMRMPLPEEAPLAEAWDVVTIAISGDDDYAAPQLWVEEWIAV